MTDEVLAWIADVNPTDEMIERARTAKSLDSMVIEGEVVVYVRDGNVYAYVDQETGHMIDVYSGLTIAVVDMESDMIYPLAPESVEEE